jgi:hypothetical protein
MKKYLTAEMSMLGGPAKRWRFRNPWTKPAYLIREKLLMNKFVLPLLDKAWASLFRLATRKHNYYAMRIACKKLEREIK